ncbi:MAG: glycosyltransferase family 39 protein [Actinomycetota bacterium]|nr:glycosyltransferase family 39 protein [Actinomycetota bacterium]
MVRTETEVPEEGDVNAPVDQRPEWSPLLVLAISAVVLFVVARFFGSNWGWFRPFLRDLDRWTGHPSIGGIWTGPAGPLPRALAVVALGAGLGWEAARVLVRWMDLAGERMLVAGIAIVLGIGVLGYGGMLGVVLGALSAPVLLVCFMALGASLLVLDRRAKRQTTEAPAVVHGAPAASAPRRSRLVIITAAFAIVVLAFTTLHAVLSPVQEWDATVYHAASARLWFLERPAPPVLYGPSIGIEISENYPPLFPAAGAAAYTLLGRFDDLYLRVFAPLLLLSTVLMTFGYARRRFDERTASFAVLILLGTPLMVMYGAWPTSYILLAPLLLASAIAADSAAVGGGSARWAAAGVIGGLAILSNVYGLMILPIGIAAAVIRGRSRRFRSMAIFVGVALLVASPWLLRNFVWLRDPFYPLGTPPFIGKGLTDPLWSSAKDAIKSAALFYWGTTSAAAPRLDELTTALFDMHLLPVGLYLCVALGFGLWRRSPTMLYLATALTIIILVLLVPGWYWLRAIVPGLPIAALLAGRGAAALIDSGRSAGRAGGALGRIAHAASVLTVVVVLVAGGVLGASLAIAGPNQGTWTTNLHASDDLMRSVENLGAPERQLRATFGDDVSLWGWINRHMDSEHRVATLEIRTYYIAQPEDLFYLDGLEAEPLVHMSSPAEAEGYLLDQHVGYIMIPSWAFDRVTQRPYARVLPLFAMLGSPRFRAVAAFSVHGNPIESTVYAVGSR